MTRCLWFLAFLVTLSPLPAFSSAGTSFMPHGAGHLFASVDEAAIDALAMAHQLQTQSRNPRLSHGGTILSVAGGYTYTAIEIARPAAPDRLRLRLGSTVVAHFHTYPAQGRKLDRLNESHSAADRRVVDELDARHRPSYILTPSLRVLVYRGQKSRIDNHAPLATLVPSLPSGSLAKR